MLKKILITVLLLILLAAGFIVYDLRSSGILRAPQYDTVGPVIPELQHPAILVLSKTNGFIHKEGLPAAGAMLAELATANGWHIYQSENAATHNASDLARFDVVVWNNTSGDILTPSQREDFKVWLTSGGKWLGLHAAGGDFTYDWNWYVDTLLGAQFIGHTMSPQFQDADVLISNSLEPLTAHLANPWRIQQEEWYAFDRNPRESGATILLSLDESSYKPEGNFFMEASMPGEHPIAWSRRIGQGTVIYSAIGHTAHTYSVPEYRTFIANAINQMLEKAQ